MRGGNNRMTDEEKALKGTLRVHRIRPAPDGTEALTRWPPAPKSFNALERDAWRELGRLVLPLRTVGKADLLFCQDTVRLRARLQAAWDNPETPTTTLNALLGISTRLLSHLGLSPVARRGVSPLAAAKARDDDPDNEFTG